MVLYEYECRLFSEGELAKRNRNAEWNTSPCSDDVTANTTNTTKLKKVDWTVSVLHSEYATI